MTSFTPTRTRFRQQPLQRAFLGAAVLASARVSVACAMAFSLSSSRANCVESDSKIWNRLHSFFVLRHGETDANAGGLIQGSSDFSRLTEKGKTQAEKVAKEAFSSIMSENEDLLVIDSVYVSPLTRARESWNAFSTSVDQNTVLLPCEETVLDKLREIDLYEWEGRHKDELQQMYPEAYQAWKVGDPHNFVVSDATQDRRPLLELWARADKVWSEIREMEAMRIGTSAPPQYDLPHCSLLVCHGSLGQALLGSAMGWDATHFRKHEFPNCGLAQIEWDVMNSNQNATKWRWQWPHTSDWQFHQDGVK